MYDIKLTDDGDIDVSQIGDFSLTESIRQAVRIRLRWIHQEWRLGPEYGFPWFEEVFVKNPNLAKIRNLVCNEVLQVEGVTAAEVNDITFDAESRSVNVRFTFSVGEEKYREEVALNG